MTVAQFIEKLKDFPQDLPVCVADWGEDYSDPSERAAEKHCVIDGPYSKTVANGETMATGPFLCIGREPVN